MDTASCLQMAPSSVQRFRNPWSRFGPCALRRTTFGRSSRQAPGSQGSDRRAGVFRRGASPVASAAAAASSAERRSSPVNSRSR
eukprot:CAMPEP_0168495252 /NCGR_PEP_ID=MMETSP0228-20121227/71645_1 /TAXON_ID=133427 /ORGANISM="Protoceratium reticulatum, Strain CCCM 535 (=CCMP 1889)" /LENGTH=83 /DNA_ID=CAMNT_0008512073 /DNA_START=259 /DNA_END=510 /DNA_ORIENTATION=-